MPCVAVFLALAFEKCRALQDRAHPRLRKAARCSDLGQLEPFSSRRENKTAGRIFSPCADPPSGLRRAAFFKRAGAKTCDALHSSNAPGPKPATRAILQTRGTRKDLVSNVGVRTLLKRGMASPGIFSYHAGRDLGDEHMDTFGGVTLMALLTFQWPPTARLASDGAARRARARGPLGTECAGNVPSAPWFLFVKKGSSMFPCVCR